MPSLSEVLLKYAEQGAQALLPAAEEIVQHGHLAEYLHELLEGRVTTVPDSLPLAYRHPNGFTKIRLVSLDDFGWTIRIHVWAQGSSDYDIHSHRWDFASQVLFGNLSEDTYRLGSGQGTYVQYQCSPSIEGRYTFNFLGNCNVELVSQGRYQQGTSYTRDAQTLHLAYTKSASGAVTLFVQGPAKEASTRVIRRFGSDQAIRNVATPRCSDLEVISSLKEVAGLIHCG